MRGRVRAAGPMLTSSLGKRQCVYWEIRAGLDDERPRAQEGVDFWLEDATGRVLVHVERVAVDARAERSQRVLGQVERDIHAVSERARVVKAAIRQNAGNSKALHAEKRKLAELATLLCAVKAHARGRVHIGGSLTGQRDWIAARAQASDSSDPASASLQLAIDEWEVAIEDGYELEVEGECAREAAPGGVGGYRDAPTALVLRAPSDGSLKISGIGANASTATRPAGPSAGDRARASRPTREKRPSGDAEATRRGQRRDAGASATKATDRTILLTTVIACTLGAILAWWLTR